MSDSGREPVAAVLAIGSELTAGRVVDTNSSELSRRLAGELGVRTVLHLSCPDELPRMIAALDVARQAAPLVLVTGGLGPTSDDITRDAVAAFSGRPLELHEPSLDHIRELYRRFQREMPETNRVQAMLPRGAEVVVNRSGTAPGFAVPDDEGGLILVAPGVPRELRAMWDDGLRRRVEDWLGARRVHVVERHLRTCGVAESQLQSLLDGLGDDRLELAYAVKEAEGTVALTFTSVGAVEEARAVVDGAFTEACARIGAAVCGLDEETLPARVGRLLAERGERIATVERETAGRLAGLLSSDESAARRLVSGQILAPVAEPEFDPASTAEELAAEARARSGAERGLALILAADEEGDAAWIGIADAGGRRSHRRRVGRFARARERNYIFVAAAALDALRRRMEDDAPGGSESEPAKG